MAKRKVTITRTMEVEIELEDMLVSEKGLEAFSSYMWEVDEPDDIFEHAAYHIIHGNGGQELDFIGVLGKEGISYNGKEADSIYTIIDDWVEYEFE